MANSIFWAGGKVWWRWKLQQRGFVPKVRMWRKPFFNLAKNDFCKLLNLHICEETLLWNLRQRHRGPWQSGGQRFKPRENMKIALSQVFFAILQFFPIFDFLYCGPQFVPYQSTCTQCLFREYDKVKIVTAPPKFLIKIYHSF